MLFKEFNFVENSGEIPVTAYQPTTTADKPVLLLIATLLVVGQKRWPALFIYFVVTYPFCHRCGRLSSQGATDPVG